MARLNEPQPPPLESLDALKRRFIRQNREIARANSTQSLRIRNLEAETSRLLSENISLREQNINLQNAAGKNQTTCLLDNVTAVKDELQAKVKELSSLIEGLGGIHNVVQGTNLSQRSENVHRKPAKQSPEQRQWKNAFALSDATGNQDGKLPAIVEGKAFPRRTLDAEELLGIVSDPANSTESPDLGPPPIAHFVEEDPIKFDPGQRPTERRARLDGADEETFALPANLETRKKRRDSITIPKSKSSSRFELKATQPPGNVPNPAEATLAQPLKAGAKRKLDVRDDKQRTDTTSDAEPDGFQFNRRTGPSNESNQKATPNSIDSKVSRKISQDLATARGVMRDKHKPTPELSQVPERRALGPKSVNADPSSPLKKNSATITDKIADLKKDAAKKAGSRERNRDRIPTVTAFNPQKAHEQAQEPVDIHADDVEIPPETPAGLDLLSPGSSKPSTARPESRDTPPPPDLNPSTSTAGGANVGGRAARRASASVNYAEPRLNVKMRRPTKELMDAVSGSQRGSILKADSGRAESEGVVETGRIRTVVIKKEEGRDQSWKTLPPAVVEQEQFNHEPASPLGVKTGAISEDLPASVMMQRRRRTSVMHQNQRVTESEKVASASAAAISALVNGSKKGKEQGPRTGVMTLDEAMEKLDIYEFHESSPHESGYGAKVDREALAVTRSSRRHSALPNAMAQASLNTNVEMEAAKAEKSPETAQTSPDGIDEIEKRKQDPPKVAEDLVSNGVKELRAAKSVIGIGNGIEPSGRAERAALRRRSMML
ncbi:MAG: hypothetical protein M1827_005448 [Pycnora praestabilis]|nr:MAG: hypothetical protein M1827_005448 [Pycnora praestabilis]